LGGFVACGALSERNDDPTRASRPWDEDRDWFFMGDGARILLLEELEHAKSQSELSMAVTSFSQYFSPYSLVNAGNCVELAAHLNVDGFLVGGASLKVGCKLFYPLYTFSLKFFKLSILFTSIQTFLILAYESSWSSYAW
ncbi:hypothetical protein KI387_038105, partial [Taxus chinensis]